MPTVVSSASPEETPPQVSTPETTSSDRNSIGFLLNCPAEADFMQEFPKSTTMSPNSTAATFAPLVPTHNDYGPSHGDAALVPMPQYQEYGHLIQESNLDVFLSHLKFQTFEQSTHNWQMPYESMMLWSGQDSMFLDRDVLERRASEIRGHLKYTSLTQNPPHSPPKALSEAIELITANTMAVYLKLYFRHWHKHAPLVHEPSFNPSSAALPLVLALMSLGGMVIGPSFHDVRAEHMLIVT